MPSLLSSALCDARLDLTSAPPCSFSLMFPCTLPGLHAPRHKTFRGVHDGFQGIDGNLKVTPVCTCSEGLFLFFTFFGKTENMPQNLIFVHPNRILLQDCGMFMRLAFLCVARNCTQKCNRSMW